MTQVTVLPHSELCPKGAILELEPGMSICDGLLANDIEIDHACGQSCACSTCHIVVREGFDGLAPADEFEEDLLDGAWGLESTSRLSCQALVSERPLVIEIPRYTVNLVSEVHKK